MDLGAVKIYNNFILPTLKFHHIALLIVGPNTLEQIETHPENQGTK
jgi:hypothetical protein